jgi:hypothetical protein
MKVIPKILSSLKALFFLSLSLIISNVSAGVMLVKFVGNEASNLSCVQSYDSLIHIKKNQKIVVPTIPYLTIKGFMEGGADSSQVIFINDQERSGIFSFDPKDKLSLPDSAMVLVFGERRYKRLTNHLTPEFFGAKRDGVSDDASAIQKTLDFASKHNGAKIVFSPGIYLVGSTLRLKPTKGAPEFNYNLMLLGAGLGTTEIKGTDKIKGNLFEMNYGQTKFVGRTNRVIIKDISFTAGGADRCFYADYISTLRLEDCGFTGGQQYTAQIGSDDPTQNYSTYITRCYFGGWTTTGGLNKGTLVIKNSLFVVIEQMETDGGRIGIDFYNSAACIVNSSKIEGCKYAGIRIRGNLNGEHRITNNYIICYGGTDFNAQFDGELHGILIQGNKAGSSAANTIANNIIRVESAKDLNVVAKISSMARLKYNASDYLVTGKKSGATAHVMGINEDTKSMALVPVSGTFIKGEVITQAKSGGSAIVNEIVKATTYGIKLEGNNGSSNISGNQLTTQPTYGIHISSDSNVIMGNTISGATGVYCNANGISLTGNIFWCVKEPAVAIHKAGGENFMSLNNTIAAGSIVGLKEKNVIASTLQTQEGHTMFTNKNYSSKINLSGNDIFHLGNSDASNINLVGLNGSTLWLGNSKQNDLSAKTLGVTPEKVVVIKDVPTSAAGLPSGAIWMDKAAGNVLKIVP